MTKHVATVEWTSTDRAAFADRSYSRAHDWTFDGGTRVPGSPAPTVVRPPMSDPAGVDPEEALVAALASCHMLFFLDFASRDGVIVDAYRDTAVAELGMRDDGRFAIRHAVLRPQVTLADPADAPKLADLHHRAHEACFISNSVNFPIDIEAQP